MELKLEGWAAVPALLCCCVCSAVPIIFMVYLGIYAFNNPDQEAWYGLDTDGKGALFASEDAGLTGRATELVDIHARFVTWFLWGFIQTLVLPLSATILVGLGMLIHPSLGSFCSGLLGCGMSCGGLAWWITGIVWRFRSDGAYATGDVVPEGKDLDAWEAEISADDSLFQYKSGKFMFIYYVICWSMMACGCLTSLCGAIAGCLSNK